MYFDMTLFKSFCAVAELGSISRAANVLHLSQPAISQQIKRLEEQLEVILFERGNRGLTLTSVGERILSQALGIEQLEGRIRDIVAHKEIPGGTLRIGTYSTISSYLIAKPVANLIKTFPGVKLSYCYDSVDLILAKIKSGDLDAAILSDIPSNTSLEVSSLFEDELVFAVSAERARELPKKLKTTMLSKINFLSYALWDDLCYRPVQKRFGRYLTGSHVVLETTSFDTIKQMLIQSAGGTFIPKYLIHSELKEGTLKILPIGNIRLPVQFYFVSAATKSKTPALKAFREILMEHFKLVWN